MSETKNSDFPHTGSSLGAEGNRGSSDAQGDRVDASSDRNVEWLASELKLRERLLGVVGHDLRSPLSAIIAGTEFALRHPSVTDGQRRRLLPVLSSARRMDRMISDLVDYTRTRVGGSIPLVVEATNVGAICRDVLDEVTIAYPNRAIDYQAGDDGDGEWDGARIGQAITNLLSNALQYSPASSTVTLRWFGTPESSIVEVHNVGAPIADDQLRELFEPFRRGTDRRSSQGLGLGLYIVDQVVQAHGGSVEAQSSECDGTVFRIVLPRTQARRLGSNSVLPRALPPTWV